jgi:hypothetical protein
LTCLLFVCSRQGVHLWRGQVVERVRCRVRVRPCHGCCTVREVAVVIESFRRWALTALVRTTHSGAVQCVCAKASDADRQSVSTCCRVLGNDTNGTDGLWVDNVSGVLYVGQLLDGGVMRWNLRNTTGSPPEPLPQVPCPLSSLCSLCCAAETLHTLHFVQETFSVVPFLSLIDDFTVVTDDTDGDQQLVLAHYGKNTIEAVDIPSPNASSAGPTTVIVPESAGSAPISYVHCRCCPSSLSAVFVVAEMLLCVCLCVTSQTPCESCHAFVVIVCSPPPPLPATIPPHQVCVRQLRFGLVTVPSSSRRTCCL